MDDKPESEQNGLSGLPLEQITLPVICAAFVALVVVVVACCLTRKQSGSTSKPSARSVYSNDTSSDTSECGVYDIISEIQTKPRTKVSSCQQFEDPRPSCSHSTPISETLYHKHISAAGGKHMASLGQKHPEKMTHYFPTPFTIAKERKNKYKNGHIQALNEDILKDKEEDANGDGPDNDRHEEGVYETLSRHWKRMSVSRHISSPATHCDEFESNAGEPTHRSETQYIEENNTNNSNHLLCQLTVFTPPSDGSCSPSTSRTLCLYSIEGASQIQEHFLETLQNSKLLVIPKPECDSEAPLKKTRDIFLSPVDDEEKEIYRQLQSSDQALNFSLSSPYARLKSRQATMRSSFNKVQLRRSSSFQEENKQPSDNKRVEKCHRRRRSDFVHSGQGNPAGLTDNEMQKILAKLGPLPPLPNHCAPPSDVAGEDKTCCIDSSHRAASPLETTHNEPVSNQAKPTAFHSRFNLNCQRLVLPTYPKPPKDEDSCEPTHPGGHQKSSDGVQKLHLKQSLNDNAKTDMYHSVIAVDNSTLKTNPDFDPKNTGDSQCNKDNGHIQEPIYFELEDNAAFSDESESDEAPEHSRVI